jgi:CRISPR/Cas system-associated exonuclease Cas4 (RecB family)
MIEFQKNVSIAEKKSFYLNLTDDGGVSHGEAFPDTKKPLWIITGNNRYKASMASQNKNQIWGGLRSWYNGEKVNVGDTIKVKYDPESRPIEDRIPIEITITKSGPALPEMPQTISPEDEEDRAIPPAEVTMQMEQDLENFLENNLGLIEEGLELFTTDDDVSGRQFFTDVGEIDLLCKNSDELVVVELKKGRSSDNVVGQISRYMGWVEEHISNNKKVRGIIIVHDFDRKLMYAVRPHSNIELKYYRIKIDFISEEEAMHKTN